jgi:twitching motility protein PilT
MELERLIQMARDEGASDLHLESGLPPALRVRGELRLLGEPIPATALTLAARELVGDEGWEELTTRGSFDLSRTLAGVRCRVNVMRTVRGFGLAIRLLARFQLSLRRLNLHPDLALLTQHSHGLVLVSGPTGCGKSTTLAALVNEINAREARHIITIESPIEYALTPRLSLVRQREVGRDTVSVEQALVDALREDPDVLMVAEMREPATMRLTLNAAETGHLVLATLHSGSAAEALARVVASFAAEIQPGICAQLADCLAAVVCQTLVYRAELGINVPECEILVASTAAKSVIRQGAFSKLQTVLESGAADGQWSRARYREWLARRADLYVPETAAREAPAEELERSQAPAAAWAGPGEREPAAERRPQPGPRATVAPVAPASPAGEARVLVIAEDEGDPAAILDEIEGRSPSRRPR